MRKKLRDGLDLETPWKYVKAVISLAKHRSSMRFLTSCRRRNVTPLFKRNCSKAAKLFGQNAGVEDCEIHFHRKLLSRIIRTKYQSIAELEEFQQRIARLLRMEYPEDNALWVLGHGRVMSGRVEGSTGGKEIERISTVTANYNDRRYSSEQVLAKSIFDTKNRVTVEDNMAGSVSEVCMSLLSPDPGFVPSRPATKRIVRDVEVACERYAFGYRWSRKLGEKSVEAATS